MSDRKTIAAIVTVYFPRSHADVIITKFLKGFPSDDGLHPPQVEIVSMYLDQVVTDDIGIEVAEEFGIRVFESIPGALKLGGNELAVDGVLLIGEHGDYAWNELKQQMYPRKYFFEQICGVLATSGKSVPVFNDKHLSYNWRDALWMYDRAQELNVPFMAGSSVPVAWRDPFLEHELGAPIEEAVAASYSGLDIYGFHALELMQCMVERRSEKETGIASVQCLEGDLVWDAGDEGIWSRELLEASLARVEPKESVPMEDACENPAVFLVEYRDGFKAATLMLTGYIQGFGYAARVGGEIKATAVILPDDPHAHFSYLSRNIQEMYLTGVPQYPVERTLLASGALEALMKSRHQGHIRIETPHLDVVYESYREPPIRPTAPRATGQSIVPFADRES